MQCINSNQKKCNCEFNVKTVGICDVSRLNIDGTKRANLNWTEISVPEILTIPAAKPDIETIDQVYANVVLDNVKLIETPFAYKQYTLASFIDSLDAITTDLGGLVTAVGTTVGAVTTALGPLLTALNVLVGTLGGLIAIPGVSALIATVNGIITSLNALIDGLNNSVTAITTAANNLLAAITAGASPGIICNLIQVLIAAVNALEELILSVIPLLNGILATLNAAAAAIGNPLVTTAVGLVTAILATLINTTLPTLITAVTDALNAILSLLAGVDCQSSTVFVIIGNSEGTCLSGRKIILEGKLNQKVVYTAEELDQSVHSAHFDIPFTTYMVAYASFENATYTEGVEVIDPETGETITVNGFVLTSGSEPIVNLNEEFTVQTCIEDIYIYQLDVREIFKNVTVFFKAIPNIACK